MEKRAEKVDELIKKLFMPEDADKSGAILVYGLVRNFGFDLSKVKEHRMEIRELLMDLPPQFYRGTGDGWSFLNFCFDKNWNQWGEHPTGEALIAMGIAAGFVELSPRELWDILPGGVPYVTIDLNGRIYKDEEIRQGI